MELITTIYILGSLCSIYSVFKNKGKKPPDSGKFIANSILVLDTLKDSHNHSQSLREFVRWYRNEKLDPEKTTAFEFEKRLRDFHDSVKVFSNILNKFQKEDFAKKEIESDPIVRPYSKQLGGVYSSVQDIQKYLKKLEPTAEEVIDWNDNWLPDQYYASKDISKLDVFVITSEEPARQVLLASDSAIIYCIEILRGFAVELL
jgi:hypothetical protein